MRNRRLSRKAAGVTALALLAATLVAPGARATGADRSPGIFVVSFEDRITSSARAAVRATGARVIGYEPTDSYLVWATPRQARGLDGLVNGPSVADVTPLSSERKLGIEAASVGATMVNVITVTPGVDGLAGALEELGAFHHLEPAGGALWSLTATVPGAAIARLAARPDVMYVEPASTGLRTEDEMTTQTLAGNIGEDRRSLLGYAEWLGKVRLSGKGVRVAVVDTGISESHPDLEGRIAKTFDYGTGPIQETPYDIGGHGTHVAGIVAGAPSGSGPLYADPDGFLYGQGVAPQAELINQNLLGTFSPSTGGEDNHVRFRGVAADAYRAGARVWNASWHTGQGNRAGYLASVRVFDELTRDVLPKKDGSEDFTFVFSAGNAGGSGPTVPKEAKNIIAVGATNSGRGLQYPQSTDPETVASFSSIGPTKDGRIFPTVVAPGANVVSARSIEGSSIGCATPLDAVLYYCVLSGTSMAAPHVAGSVALIQQWWKREIGGSPSPAITKALLVNSATDIAIPDVPNIFEGWGRVNLGDLFAPGPRRIVDQEVRFDSLGESRSYEVETNGKGPLRITLNWSDAPALVGAEKVLVNDLDLIVERIESGRVVAAYRGNVFSGGGSTKGGKADRLNNLENVFLADPAPGTYRITVSVANLPGDGVPNNSDRTDQDFALVIDGAS